MVDHIFSWNVHVQAAVCLSCDCLVGVHREAAAGCEAGSHEWRKRTTRALKDHCETGAHLGKNGEATTAILAATSFNTWLLSQRVWIVPSPTENLRCLQSRDGSISRLV